MGIMQRANIEAAATVKTAPSPLVIAASAGRQSIAALLLEARALVNASDGRGCRPLPCAAMIGKSDLCRFLLDNDADVDSRGTNGMLPTVQDSERRDIETETGATALSIAAASGDIHLIQLLLERKANCELVDERGLTPLLVSARGGYHEICTSLLTARANVDALEVESLKTALVLAAGANHSKICSALLNARAAVDAQTATGVTALHAAAANGHEEV